MSEEKESWAVVELMGHIRLAGRLSEEERFGCKMGRLDIPIQETCPTCNGSQAIQGCVDCSTGYRDSFVTQYFGGSAVFRITPVTEEVARHVSKTNKPEPVHAWEFPKQISALEPSNPTRERFHDDEDHDECDYEEGPF